METRWTGSEAIARSDVGAYEEAPTRRLTKVLEIRSKGSGVRVRSLDANTELLTLPIRPSSPGFGRGTPGGGSWTPVSKVSLPISPGWSTS